MRFRIYFGILALAAALSEPALSQELTREAKIREIMAASLPMENLDLGYQAMRQASMRSFRDVYQSRSHRTMSDDQMHRVAAVIDDEFKTMKPALIDFMVGFFKQIYTPLEIDAMYDFYATPVGKSILRKQGELPARIMAELQVWMQKNLIPRLEARLAQDPQIRELFR